MAYWGYTSQEWGGLTTQQQNNCAHIAQELCVHIVKECGNFVKMNLLRSKHCKTCHMALTTMFSSKLMVLFTATPYVWPSIVICGGPFVATGILMMLVMMMMKLYGDVLGCKYIVICKIVNHGKWKLDVSASLVAPYLVIASPVALIM